MAKTFYTERDIEDLARHGVRQLEIHDDIVVTDAGREKAEQLGIRLVRQPVPGRRQPDIREPGTGSRQPGGESHAEQGTLSGEAFSGARRPETGDRRLDDALVERVKASVLAQAGFSVDPQFLETIIRLVLAQLQT
jgi:hypothetical protein